MEHAFEDPATPYYSGGMIFRGGKVLRGGRWGCALKHCPYENYPAPYPGGQYLLNAAAVHALAGPGMEHLDPTDPYVVVPLTLYP
jgi:hypothetical protein